MARKTVNKSQAIRDYKAANQNATPSQIVEALARQGVEVTAGAVSTTLWQAKQKRAGSRTRNRKPAGTRVTVKNLLAAQEFAKKHGGAHEAKSLIAAICRIQSAAN